MKKVNLVLTAFFLVLSMGGKAGAEWLTFNGGAINEPPVCQLVSSDNSGVVVDLFLPALYYEPWSGDPSFTKLTIPEQNSANQGNSEFLWIAAPTEPAGFPELPQIKFLVAIPKGSMPTVSVEDSFISNANFYDGLRINPILNYLPGLTEYAYNDSVYTSGDFYPPTFATFHQDKWRDLDLIEVTVTPVRWLPPFGQGQSYLAVWDELRININFTNPATDTDFPDLGYFGGIGNAIITNYNRPYNPPIIQAGSWSWAQGVPSICDYLIIAGNQVSATAQDSAKIEELATHRANLNGFNVSIVKTADIPNATSWVGIRDFLIDVYYANTSVISSDGHVVYVLLVGDAWVDQPFGPIPTTPIIPRTEAVPPENLSFGSDHYYANLDSLGATYFEDLAIGRLPVGNSAELTTAIDKIISYETTPTSPEHAGWKKNICIQAGPMIDLNPAGQWVWNQFMEQAQQSQIYNLTNMFLIPALSEYHSYLAEAYHFSTGPVINVDDRFHTDYNVYAPQDSAYTRDNWLYPNLNGSYPGNPFPNSEGVGGYLYAGHGCNGCLAFQMHPVNGPYFWAGIQGTPIAIQDSDRLPFYWLAACLTGNFDFDDSLENSLGYLGGDIMWDNFCEHLTVKDERGAIIAIGAIDNTYQSTQNCQYHWFRYLTGAISALTEPYMDGAGGAYLMLAKNMSGSEPAAHYVYFGDPAVNLRIEPTSGNITQNTTWNGRVDLVGNVLVQTGVTLTINPGAEIVLHNGTWLQVNGKIIAEGSSAEPIKFRGGTTPGYGLVLNHLTNPLSRITNCEFERLQYGVKIDSVNLEVAIANNEFTDCDYGIFATHTHTQLEYNSFDNCGIGLYVEQYNGTAWSDGRIKGNVFANCDSLALALMGGTMKSNRKRTLPASGALTVMCSASITTKSRADKWELYSRTATRQ